MALKGQIVKWGWDGGDTQYELYAKEGQAEKLLNGLDNLERIVPAPQDVEVGGFSRARYPRGPKRSVRGHTRTTLIGNPSNFASLPGRNAYLEVTTGEGDDRKTKVTTVSFTGPFTQFYIFVQANAKRAMVLRSPDGTPFNVAGAALV